MVVKIIERKSSKKIKNEENIDGDKERAMTPREKMLRRKSQKADAEAERVKLEAIKNFADNQKRYSNVKKKKNKIMPPWVGEHPDIFDDPNFSITAMDSLQLKGTATNEQLSNESMMEVSGGGGASASVKLPGNEYIPEDEQSAEAYYSQFDDFEMELSAGSSEEGDSDYQAIIECIEEALSLPSIEMEKDEVMLGNNGSQQLGGLEMAEPHPVGDMEPRPVSPPPPPVTTHDEISPFTPLARDKRITLLKEEGRKVLGNETFQRVYEYLKAVRQQSEVNEAVVMNGLKQITSNTRDCFIIDQLVFLEKQLENTNNDLF